MGKGAFAVSQWEEIRKAGGRAINTGKLQELFEKDGDRVLTRKELIQIVTEYFESCIEEVENENGEIVSVWARTPTKSGLALALNIDSQTLIDYIHGTNCIGKPYSPNKPDYKRRVDVADFDILRKAYSVIEDFFEQRLGLNINPAGTIFWLTNSTESRWTNEHRLTVDHEQKKLEARTPEQIAEQYAEPLEGLPQMPDFPDTEESEE